MGLSASQPLHRGGKSGLPGTCTGRPVRPYIRLADRHQPERASEQASADRLQVMAYRYLRIYVRAVLSAILRLAVFTDYIFYTTFAKYSF